MLPGLHHYFSKSVGCHSHALQKVDSIRLLVSPNEKRVSAEMTKTLVLPSADERT